MMKKLFIALLSIAVFLLLVFLVVAKPYETIYEQRVSTDPVNVVVEFVNVTGDSNCAKLYVTESDSNVMKGSALFPSTPDNIPTPDDGVYAYAGNVFKLTGYAYEWVFRNAITGNENKKNSRRFDVIKWEIMSPYTVWSERQGADGVPLTEILTTPLAYEFKSEDYRPVLFEMNNYIDCLAGQ